MKNKLKIIGSISVYSTQNSWEIFRDIVKPIKEGIISGEIKVSDIRYANEFDKEYNPYTNESNWGTNLDEFHVKVNKDLKASISYFYIPRWSSFSEKRDFKFDISFKLPEKMLSLFKHTIDQEFHYKCSELRQMEIEFAEQKRIKEIGQELLNN